MASDPDYVNGIVRAGFIPVNSFEGGFTLTSSNQALYSGATNEYFIWKGSLPKVVAAGATPDTSGGFGPAAWANVSYSAIGSASGAALVGYGKAKLEDILSVDVRQFGAKTISEDPIFDSQPAFQAAINYVKSKGGGIVKFSGSYLINSAGYNYTLPFDDGTVSPNFINAGVDNNIPAEPQSTMPVCLEIASNVQLVGDGIKNSSLNFGWDRNNGVIDCHQNIGIVFRVQGYPSSNRMNAYINNVAISGFAIYNAFIGVVADGILFDASYIGDMQYQNCGISFIAQGADSVDWGTQVIANCYAGIIIGGMWLTRNNVQLGNIWVPPYKNNDIYALGWCDYVKVEKIAGTMASLPWGDRHVEIDTFFDRYFFKSVNNIRTAEKGRLSNTGMDLITPSDYSNAPFRGIASRYFVNLSRYNRGNANLHIEDMKVYFCSRTPVLSAYAQGIDFYGQVSNAFVEMVGKKAVGPSTDENNFYKSGVDPLNHDYTWLPALVVEGALGAVKASLANTFFANPSTSSPTTNSKLVTQQWVPSTTAVANPTAFTSGTALRYHSAYDGNSAVIIERLWNKRYETQPLSFDWQDANPLHLWRTRVVGHAESKFDVKNGNSNVSLEVTNKTSSLYYQGGRVKCFISFTFPSDLTGFSDYLVISGLPRENVAAHDFGFAQPVLTVQRAVTNNRLYPVSGGAGTVALPIQILSARLDSGSASFFADHNSLSGSHIRCSDMVAGSQFAIILEFNTTWGFTNNNEG
jgi:hypothetical protein